MPSARLTIFLALVLLFTVGTLINYRPFRPDQPDENSPLLGTQTTTTEEPSKQPKWWQRPDNTRFRKNITSRFLAHFPFLIEIVYWNLVYWIYQLARALTAVTIRNNIFTFNKSRNHALAILTIERSLHLAFEQPIQAWILQKAPGLMNICASIYYSHITVSVVFIVYTYTYFQRHHFQQIRRSMATCNIIAFTILSIYRVMPPRLLPSQHGFVDVLHPSDGKSGSSWNNNRFQLTIAAMPSEHFGVATLISYSLTRWSPHTWIRLIAPLWPVVMLFTIIATANHFFLDACVGGLVTVAAFACSDVMLIFRPIEEWVFWMARTEKPESADQDPPEVKRWGSVWRESWT